MLQTPIGKLIILLNGEEIDYKENFLSTEAKSFTVDKRVQIQFTGNVQLGNGDVIKFLIDMDKELVIKSGAETGEDLQLISFYYQYAKLSIGIEEIKNMKYVYLENGIALEANVPMKIIEINAIVAWLKMNNADLEDTFTWYAADPTLL